MFIIDLTLKHNPLPLSVQRKELADAETTYRQILDAMARGTPVELTCEHQPDKRLMVITSEIAAVQLTEKSAGGTAAGRGAGFFNFVGE